VCVLTGLYGDFGSVGRGSGVEEAGVRCMCVFLPDSVVTLDRFGRFRVWKRPGSV
jgi:hypothetical protein